MSGKRASMAPEGPGVRPSAMPRPLAFLAASARGEGGCGGRARAGAGWRGGCEQGCEARRGHPGPQVWQIWQVWAVPAG